MMILKVTQKQSFTPSLEDSFFEKPERGVKLTAPSLLRVKPFEYYNLHQIRYYNETLVKRKAFLRTHGCKNTFYENTALQITPGDR